MSAPCCIRHSGDKEWSPDSLDILWMCHNGWHTLEIEVENGSLRGYQRVRRRRTSLASIKVVKKKKTCRDWSGIRTHARRLVPKTSALDHSAIQPLLWHRPKNQSSHTRKCLQWWSLAASLMNVRMKLPSKWCLSAVIEDSGHCVHSHFDACNFSVALAIAFGVRSSLCCRDWGVINPCYCRAANSAGGIWRLPAEF